MSYNTPHFDLPFRLAGRSFATVEQDTIDDVANCVVAALRTHVGWRPEMPEYGTPDIAFRTQPLDLQEIIAQIVRNEPRAVLFMQQNPDRFDALVTRVVAEVSTTEGS